MCKKIKKYSLILISVLVISIFSYTSILYYGLGVLPELPHIGSYLPNKLDYNVLKDNTKFSEEPIEYKKDNETLIIIPKYGPMSFSSNSNVIGLFNSKDELVEEIIIGSIPIRLKEWKKDEIIFKVIAKREVSYLNNFLDKNHKLGSYKCIFIYP